MSDLKNKYLKYKQKYLNLKKMIGRGMDAGYEKKKKGDQLEFKKGDQLILTHLIDDDKSAIINYTIDKKLGEGGNGIVYLITNDNNQEKYIFKQGKHPSSQASYNEGYYSNLLKGILDDDMLVLFQGPYDSDFLISKYNGNDLYQEFKNKPEQIKYKYASITIQLLDLLHTINRHNIFHNDIKLQNVTIKDNRIYLIDFGFLTKKISTLGSLTTVSYKGLIYKLKNKKFLKDNQSYYNQLISFLKDTDIVGFFYCCIDLLLIKNNNFSLKYILRQLNILNYEDNSLYKLFELFYFILPNSNRTISELNEKSSYYNQLLPSEEKTKQIFSDFLDDHINLFRFMAYIYIYIKENNRDLLNDKQNIWYINFLKIMSECFLHTFNYNNFKPIFIEIVSTFSCLPDNDSNPPLQLLSQPLPPPQPLPLPPPPPQPPLP